MDLESRLTKYVTEARLRAISDLAKEEDIDEKALVKYVQEYDYLQREKPEILQRAIKQKKGLRLLQRSWLLKTLTTKLRNIISTFSWE
jgi:type I restriction enzyme R subunit